MGHSTTRRQGLWKRKPRSDAEMRLSNDMSTRHPAGRRLGVRKRNATRSCFTDACSATPTAIPRAAIVTDVGMVSLGAALIAGFAQILIALPLTPVPVPCQTFAVFIVISAVRLRLVTAPS